ncbi:MAG TPA: efflux RND transporter periplasmic adaptor subunit [Rhodopila sp.]|uniref:efflux RND transporter periplasmic adaptor subunit n=1 Tax=Rhodopila sp. TaxID=2480087 RepID=UPI002B73A199|nr:efflux RND transporter periplasmic adaptor subunit [Rhodopila sp.]HVY13585.1 efflux RND transporter periplasmic adaptor subunit [Rhodopila sp.]
MRVYPPFWTPARLTERFGQGLVLLTFMLLVCASAHAQAPGGPPSVGVVKAAPTAITESSEFIGRVQAIDRVALTARVTAFLDQRFFTEGAEVKQGDLLYRLEQAPFQAVLMQQEAAVADAVAKLANANITLARAQSLLNTPAGQRSTVDDAVANQRSAAAQVQSAQAQLKTAQINLDYTEIRAPVAGKITRTAITVGNVVSPSSGPLATIVSQDPMYVLFPVADRVLTELERRYADKGGMNAVVVRLRLPDGTVYGQTGKIDYIDPSVSATTDTILLRARIANPPLRTTGDGQPMERALVDNAFVTVLVEGIEPVTALAIPRKAVLSDQQGDYVYVVGPGNKAEIRRIQLGQSTPVTAVIASGLKEGETVVAEGIQRVRPGLVVNPGPVSPQPASGQ